MADNENKILNNPFDFADSLVERWHEGEGESQSLHEFMQLTWDEYTAFTSDVPVLPTNFMARHGRATTWTSNDKLEWSDEIADGILSLCADTIRKSGQAATAVVLSTTDVMYLVSAYNHLRERNSSIKKG